MILLRPQQTLLDQKHDNDCKSCKVWISFRGLQLNTWRIVCTAGIKIDGFGPPSTWLEEIYAHPALGDRTTMCDIRDCEENQRNVTV